MSIMVVVREAGSWEQAVVHQAAGWCACALRAIVWY
jgi:hypothetical protein